MTNKKKRGPKPRNAGREQKHVYMTPASVETVRQWQRLEQDEKTARNDELRKLRDRGVEVGNIDNWAVSFSEALEKALEISAIYMPDRHHRHYFRAVSTLFGPLWRYDDPMPWIEIAGQSGQIIRCRRCHKRRNVQMLRFARIMQALRRFVERHKDCEQQPVKRQYDDDTDPTD